MPRLHPLLSYAFYLGLPAGLAFSAMALGLAAWLQPAGTVVDLHARMAESGGWSPASLTVRVGEPVTFRLTADDTAHAFAIGQLDGTRVDLPLGERRDLTVTFDRPGKYVFYCALWCSPNHWRMRGTIEVTGPGLPAAGEPPLYVRLGLDLDAPRPTPALPAARPSAARGAAQPLDLPAAYLGQAYYRAASPAAAWQALRQEPAAQALDDQQVWDLVAWLWSRNAPTAEARTLYAENCAACHGESGAGDGQWAAALAQQDHAAQAEFGAHTEAPTDFTDLGRMLATSPAILQGKLLRGGMGTGMPYWGPIFTEAQTWALTDYLWTFVFAE
ncbi:MAG: c-type cytochrome [Anaerolineales bacterium]|nr:c-type cytochrome [Anaerolineales bacterium]